MNQLFVINLKTGVCVRCKGVGSDKSMATCLSEPEPAHVPSISQHGRTALTQLHAATLTQHNTVLRQP